MLNWDAFPVFQDVLHAMASLAVILVAGAAWFSLRGTARNGNRVQLDIDLQMIDLGPGTDLIGELMVVLQNMGARHQKLHNIFIEIRHSRRAGGTGLPIVPVTNMLSSDGFPLLLAPGVRQMLTWTFEISRDDRLLRATALINTGKWLDSETVPELAQQHFWAFGATARYVSRVFETSTSGFRRF
jgi:hypothetical protein